MRAYRPTGSQALTTPSRTGRPEEYHRRQNPYITLPPHAGSNPRQDDARMARACRYNLRLFFDNQPEHMTIVSA